jgi:hypothetical protein
LDTRLHHTRHPLERLCAARCAIATAEFAADHRRTKLPLSPVVRGWHVFMIQEHEQVIPLLPQPTPDLVFDGREALGQRIGSTRRQ